jgi:electron transfer flavoprotein alpha subunit
MPPRKKVLVPTKVESSVSSDNESSSDSDAEVVLSKSTIKNTPKVRAFIKTTTSNTNSLTSGSDRLQLAQAINNLVFKGSSFVEALNTLTEFTNEKLAELDVEIESKKREYNDLVKSTDSEYKHKMKYLEGEYVTRMKTLETDFKNGQIETKQKLTEFELKACKEMAGKHAMLLVEKSENDKAVAEKNAILTELKQLKDSFTAKINEHTLLEKKSFEAKLLQEKTNADLTHKAHTAELTAQVSQQIKEIAMLNKTIENLKLEVAEQRNLTKEVANAGAKGAITQNYGK